MTKLRRAWRSFRPFAIDIDLQNVWNSDRVATRSVELQEFVIALINLT